jgi:hypothetical protein
VSLNEARIGAIRAEMYTEKAERLAISSRKKQLQEYIPPVL